MAALLIWLQHRRALRARGYSFQQFRREQAARIKEILRPLAVESLKTAPTVAEDFDRRSLRARW